MVDINQSNPFKLTNDSSNTSLTKSSGGGIGHFIDSMCGGDGSGDFSSSVLGKGQVTDPVTGAAQLKEGLQWRLRSPG